MTEMLGEIPGQILVQQKTDIPTCGRCGGSDVVAFLEDDLVVCTDCDGPEGMA
jgi:hypothetical protein